MLMRRVQRKLPLIAAIPLHIDRTEYRALRHRAAIDVQSDGDGVVARVAYRVVFVWRNQAAGGTGTYVHRAARLKTIFAIVLLGELIRRDLERAVPDAFDAPHAAVIVNRRALARTPGHRDHRKPVLFAAVQLATRVVIARTLVAARRQLDGRVADQFAQRVAQIIGDRRRAVVTDGCVQGINEAARTREFDGKHGAPR